MPATELDGTVETVVDGSAPVATELDGEVDLSVEWWVDNEGNPVVDDEGNTILVTS